MATENPVSMNPATSYCIMLTSMASEAEADTLARQIVEARLGACMQIQRLKGVYRWQGALSVEPEWQLSIKTRQARFEALAQFITAYHAYKTPEIVKVPISAGSAALRWVDDETPE